MATQPKGRCYGATTRQSPRHPGKVPHSLGLPTYCAPAPMLSRNLDLRKGVGATDHHHTTPGDACCHLPLALSRRPLTQTRPGGQTPVGWTHPCATCGPLVPRGPGG